MDSNAWFSRTRARLEEALLGAERAARQALSGAQRSDASGLSAAMKELCAALDQELRLADEHIVDEVRASGGFGPIHALHLRAEHEDERLAARAVVEDASAKSLAEVADEVLWLVGTVRRAAAARDRIWQERLGPGNQRARVGAA